MTDGNTKNIEVIEILWDGPFSVDEALKQDKGLDYGLYQIYGTHTIFGANSLLYIGKAQDQKFANRLSQHQSWMTNEMDDLKIYLGRIGSTVRLPDTKWSEYIDCAERLLIYYCSPPYNSSNLNNYGNHRNKLVLNFGKRNRLPFEVSTLYKESNYFNNREQWRIFTEQSPLSVV